MDVMCTQPRHRGEWEQHLAEPWPVHRIPVGMLHLLDWRPPAVYSVEIAEDLKIPVDVVGPLFLQWRQLMTKFAGHSTGRLGCGLAEGDCM